MGKGGRGGGSWSCVAAAIVRYRSQRSLEHAKRQVTAWLARGDTHDSHDLATFDSQLQYLHTLYCRCGIVEDVDSPSLRAQSDGFFGRDDGGGGDGGGVDGGGGDGVDGIAEVLESRFPMCVSPSRSSFERTRTLLRVGSLIAGIRRGRLTGDWNAVDEVRQRHCCVSIRILVVWGLGWVVLWCVSTSGGVV